MSQVRLKPLELLFVIKYIFFSVDEMGQDIIAAAKEIIIQQENQRNNSDEIHSDSDIRIGFKTLQSQVKSLEDKLELILKKLK